MLLRTRIAENILMESLRKREEEEIAKRLKERDLIVAELTREIGETSPIIVPLLLDVCSNICNLKTPPPCDLIVFYPTMCLPVMDMDPVDAIKSFQAKPEMFNAYMQRMIDPDFNYSFVISPIKEGIEAKVYSLILELIVTVSPIN